MLWADHVIQRCGRQQTRDLLLLPSSSQGCFCSEDCMKGLPSCIGYTEEPWGALELHVSDNKSQKLM